MKNYAELLGMIGAMSRQPASGSPSMNALAAATRGLRLEDRAAVRPIAPVPRGPREMIAATLAAGILAARTEPATAREAVETFIDCLNELEIQERQSHGG